MSGIELPLESQLYLKDLEQRIANFSLEDLRKLFMVLATQKAKEEYAYKLFLQGVSDSERRYQHQLAKIEKECEIYKQAIARIEEIAQLNCEER